MGLDPRTSAATPATGGYRRFAWTAADCTLREWFAGEAQRRGLTVEEDRNGNLWAWWGPPDGRRPAGARHRLAPRLGARRRRVRRPARASSRRFAALDLLRAAGVDPGVPLAVVAFADEEGARFGVACVGSRLLTGALTADRALALSDADGTTLAEALTAAGRDPAHVGADPRRWPTASAPSSSCTSSRAARWSTW